MVHILVENDTAKTWCTSRKKFPWTGGYGSQFLFGGIAVLCKKYSKSLVLKHCKIWTNLGPKTRGESGLEKTPVNYMTLSVHGGRPTTVFFHWDKNCSICRFLSTLAHLCQNLIFVKIFKQKKKYVLVSFNLGHPVYVDNARWQCTEFTLESTVRVRHS